MQRLPSNFLIFPLVFLSLTAVVLLSWRILDTAMPGGIFYALDRNLEEVEKTYASWQGKDKLAVFHLDLAKERVTEILNVERMGAFGLVLIAPVYAAGETNLREQLLNEVAFNLESAQQIFEQLQVEKQDAQQLAKTITDTTTQIGLSLQDVAEKHPAEKMRLDKIAEELDQMDKDAVEVIANENKKAEVLMIKAQVRIRKAETRVAQVNGLLAKILKLDRQANASEWQEILKPALETLNLAFDAYQRQNYFDAYTLATQSYELAWGVKDHLIDEFSGKMEDAAGKDDGEDLQSDLQTNAARKIANAKEDLISFQSKAAGDKAIPEIKNLLSEAENAYQSGDFAEGRLFAYLATKMIAYSKSKNQDSRVELDKGSQATERIKQEIDFLNSKIQELTLQKKLSSSALVTAQSWTDKAESAYYNENYELAMDYLQVARKLVIKLKSSLESQQGKPHSGKNDPKEVLGARAIEFDAVKSTYVEYWY